MPKPRRSASKPAPLRNRGAANSACPLSDERTKRAQTHADAFLARARSQPSEPKQKRITPEDRPLEVRIFLAAVATGECVREAAKWAELSERRVLRWVAFCDFLPAVQDAQAKGQIAKRHPHGQEAFDAGIELRIALQDRDLQRSADRYAAGDRDRLHEMWMSGELVAIYDREAIANLRQCGKHELADHYERALAAAPAPQPIDYVGETLRSLGLE